jgi:hypothetical protein
VTPNRLPSMLKRRGGGRQVPHEAKDRFFESFYNVIAEGVFVAYKVILHEKSFNLKLSGNEVYYTA